MENLWSPYLGNKHPLTSYPYRVKYSWAPFAIQSIHWIHQYTRNPQRSWRVYSVGDGLWQDASAHPQVTCLGSKGKTDVAQEMLKMREKGRNEWKKWAEKKSGSSSKKHKMSSAKTVISLQQRWIRSRPTSYLLHNMQSKLRMALMRHSGQVGMCRHWVWHQDALGSHPPSLDSLDDWATIELRWIKRC